MIIAVTGTPGTGKTVAARLLARRLGCELLELNREIVKRKMYSSYDRKRRTFVADMAKVRAFVRQYAKGRACLIVDSHLSHDLKADKVIVLRCRPDVLAKRLKARGWPVAKVRENVEAEMFGVISEEARGYEIDTTRLTPRRAAAEMERVLKTKGKGYKRIDWVEEKD
ncbi:MAG: adenylate kinase family protein [Candidatus Aenigmatarchaeota archaeon]